MLDKLKVGNVVMLDKLKVGKEVIVVGSKNKPPESNVGKPVIPNKVAVGRFGGAGIDKFVKEGAEVSISDGKEISEGNVNDPGSSIVFVIDKVPIAVPIEGIVKEGNTKEGKETSEGSVSVPGSVMVLFVIVKVPIEIKINRITNK